MWQFSRFFINTHCWIDSFQQKTAWKSWSITLHFAVRWISPLSGIHRRNINIRTPEILNKLEPREFLVCFFMINLSMFPIQITWYNGSITTTKKSEVQFWNRYVYTDVLFFGMNLINSIKTYICHGIPITDKSPECH